MVLPTALAAASRALKGYNDTLSQQALTAAIGAWNLEHNKPIKQDSSQMHWFFINAEIPAALQLYISTKDEQYAKRFQELIWPALDKGLPWNMLTAVEAVPYFGNDYKEKLKSYVEKYKAGLEELDKQSPYGIPMIFRGWGGNTLVVNWAITNYYLTKAFPEIIRS